MRKTLSKEKEKIGIIVFSNIYYKREIFIFSLFFLKKVKMIIIIHLTFFFVVAMIATTTTTKSNLYSYDYYKCYVHPKNRNTTLLSFSLSKKNVNYNTSTTNFLYCIL